MNPVSKAAAILGRKGGQAGKGVAKARDSHLMSAAALKRWGTPESRFWSYVTKGKPDECWPWKLTCRVRSGYGMFWYEGHNHQAHRLAYLFARGEFDRTKDVLHACDNPPCCNPAHLWVGTDHDNRVDCERKGRRVSPKGEQVRHLAKLTADKVRQIRSMALTQGVPHRKLARIFGVKRQSIASVVKRETWKHI